MGELDCYSAYIYMYIATGMQIIFSNAIYLRYFVVAVHIDVISRTGLRFFFHYFILLLSYYSFEMVSMSSLYIKR